MFGNKEEAWWKSLPPQKGSEHVRRAIALYAQKTGVGLKEHQEAKDDLYLEETSSEVSSRENDNSEETFEKDSSVDFEVKKKSSNDFDPLKNLMQG